MRVYYKLLGERKALIMALLNKEKLMNGFGKTIDTANGVAYKAEQFAKEKEWNKKAEEAKNKTKEFIKHNELDRTYESVKFSVGEGIKKAGVGIEKGMNGIERGINELKQGRK